MKRTDLVRGAEYAQGGDWHISNGFAARVRMLDVGPFHKGDRVRSWNKPVTLASGHVLDKPSHVRDTASTHTAGQFVAVLVLDRDTGEPTTYHGGNLAIEFVTLRSLDSGWAEYVIAQQARDERRAQAERAAARQERLRAAEKVELEALAERAGIGPVRWDQFGNPCLSRKDLQTLLERVTS